MNIEEKRNHECFQMYFKAKLLGFPDEVDLMTGRFVLEKVPINVPKYTRIKSPVYFYLNSTCLAKDVLDPGCVELNCSIYPRWITHDILILIVLMKLFYERDWDGKNWVDAPNEEWKKESFMEHVTSSVAKQMTKTIDKEIMKTIKHYFDDNPPKLNKP